MKATNEVEWFFKRRSIIEHTWEIDSALLGNCMFDSVRFYVGKTAIVVPRKCKNSFLSFVKLLIHCMVSPVTSK